MGKPAHLQLPLPQFIPKYKSKHFTALPSISWCYASRSLTFIQEPSTGSAAQAKRDRSSFVILPVVLLTYGWPSHGGAVSSLHASWCSPWNASKAAVEFTWYTCLSRSPGKNACGDRASCSPPALLFASPFNWAGGGEHPRCVSRASLCYQETGNFSF